MFRQVFVVKKNQVTSLVIQGLISAELDGFLEVFFFNINPEGFLTRNCCGGFLFWDRYGIVSVGIGVKFSIIVNNITLGKASKYVEKKGAIIISLFILILKWPNSSRNAKKQFSPW